jgi:hypothetical protein
MLNVLLIAVVCFSAGQSIPGGCVFSFDSLPDGLPVQAAEGIFHDEDLPPKHQLKRVHLLRHTQVTVVTRSHHLQR